MRILKGLSCVANKEFSAPPRNFAIKISQWKGYASRKKLLALNESIERIHLERFIRDDRREPCKFDSSRQAGTVARELRRRDALCNAFTQTENRNYWDRVRVRVYVCMWTRARARARERGNEVSRREKESVTRSFVGNVGRHCPVRHKFPNRWEMHFSAVHRAVVVRVQVVRRLHRATTAEEIREVEGPAPPRPPFLYGSLHLLSRDSPLSSLSLLVTLYTLRVHRPDTSRCEIVTVSRY